MTTSRTVTDYTTIGATSLITNKNPFDDEERIYTFYYVRNYNQTIYDGIDTSFD